MVPAAREGFVFVVNANNPVDSLTQEQIRKIYSGEITNWKEVGGNDAEIHAFQRNKDSGSYNYMKEFMGEYELCETKEKSYYYSDMNGMMDSIGEYDNGLDSIGFSVYSFASDKRFENIVNEKNILNLYCCKRLNKIFIEERYSKRQMKWSFTINIKLRSVSVC